MGNQKESNCYLSPQELLMITTKINRLCQATPETFDPKTQVSDAQDIVNTLSQIINPHGKLFSGREARNNSPYAGEYRIGNYIAKKYTGKKTTEIIFELEQNPENRTLEYDTKSLDVVKISIGRPKKRQLAYLCLTTYQLVPLWDKNKKT